MSNFFKSFPIIRYSFGDAEDPVIFQNIGTYIDLVDQIKDDAAFYTTTNIEEYERPDTLSYKLYRTTEYYWTFYLLNDKIRECGWPITSKQLYENASKYYPNRVITTTGDINGTVDDPTPFVVGATVQGLVSGTTGKILKRYPDLGQLVIGTTNNFNVGESVRVVGNSVTSIIVHSEAAQYNSVHHYENALGQWVDINPSTQSVSGLTPITYLDRLIEQNTELKEIKVLKDTVAPQIASNFRKSLLL